MLAVPEDGEIFSIIKPHMRIENVSCSMWQCEFVTLPCDARESLVGAQPRLVDPPN